MISILDTKQCTRCLEDLPTAEFGPLRAGREGLNPRCRKCMAAIAREQRAQASPEARARRAAIQRRSWVKKAYGEAGLRADERIQAGCGCDVCGGQTERMAIDHDHETGAVRGVLCKDCNLVLGWMNDDPLRLRALALYLEGHHAT